jgi:metal-responsive CopG/Arc/MetJ family transcriptional regulator
MKTAISIPDKVFESAERLANRLGTSRSQLYTQALKNYMLGQNDDEVTQKLNEVYGKLSSSFDPVLQKAQLRSLAKDTW